MKNGKIKKAVSVICAISIILTIIIQPVLAAESHPFDPLNYYNQSTKFSSGGIFKSCDGEYAHLATAQNGQVLFEPLKRININTSASLNSQIVDLDLPTEVLQYLHFAYTSARINGDTTEVDLFVPEEITRSQKYKADGYTGFGNYYYYGSIRMINYYISTTNGDTSYKNVANGVNSKAVAQGIVNALVSIAGCFNMAIGLVSTGYNIYQDFVNATSNYVIVGNDQDFIQADMVYDSTYQLTYVELGSTWKYALTAQAVCIKELRTWQHYANTAAGCGVSYGTYVAPYMIRLTDNYNDPRTIAYSNAYYGTYSIETCTVTVYNTDFIFGSI